MITAQMVSIGIALVGGMTLGLTLSALLGANGREDAADIGRIDLLETEHVFVSRAGGYIIIFDGTDMKQLAIGQDIRATIDHAAVQLLARRVRASDENVPTLTEVPRAA
jgi:hypothetical protein